MPYETRKRALALSFSLDCPIGAHKTSDGQWNPGKTEKAYQKAKNSPIEFIRAPADVSKELVDKGYSSGELTLEKLCDIQLQSLEKGEDLSCDQWLQDIINELSEKDSVEKTEKQATVFSKTDSNHNVRKVDTEKRLVIGWAQICTKNGEPYFDTDNQTFDKDETLGNEEFGWIGFMMKSRVHKAMHDGEAVGDVVFAFPAFDDVMKSLGFEPIDKEGIITGVYVSCDETLEKFHSGEYKDFSIGGTAVFEDLE